MHVQTHIMSGWCVGNWLSLTARQRLCCMIATSIADLDGLSLIFGQEAYWTWHHKLCHNLAFAVLVSAVLTIWSASRFFGFVLYLAFAHLHLLLDYFGSGPDWPLYYLWPFSSDFIVNRKRLGILFVAEHHRSDGSLRPDARYCGAMRKNAARMHHAESRPGDRPLAAPTFPTCIAVRF